MKTYFLSVVFLGGLLAVVGQADAKAEPARVGVILPLTGDIAVIGGACKNGMELAYAELDPEERAKFELVFEDDQGQPKNTISAFQRLAAAGPLHAVVTASSGTSKSLVPLTERAKVPLIAIASDPAVSRDKEYAVNFWVTPETEVAKLLGEVKAKGYRSVAIVTGVHDGTLSFKSAFHGQKPDSLAVVFDEEYPIDMRDFRTAITSMRATTFDAVFLNLFLGQIGVFARQARELGVTQPLFAVELFEDATEVENANGGLLGQWYVQADEGSGAFFEKYKARYPEASTFGAGNGYDAVMLIASALREQRRLNDYLHTLKEFSGALGTYSATGDNRFTLPATIKVVTEDGFEKQSS
ncbi:MAG: ABC transporter substrate-binding protein [Bdellovibrionales bacterium]|nr:ABC transporter substrate-binding protein [Bdellovibrionales bacterium]